MQSPQSPTAIRRRLDALALEQLRAEAARLIVENDKLREQLAYAEAAAESWRDDAMNLAHELHKARRQVALTRDGALVAIPEATTACVAGLSDTEAQA
jgi:regulator of replication initiation timing